MIVQWGPIVIGQRQYKASATHVFRTTTDAQVRTYRGRTMFHGTDAWVLAQSNAGATLHFTVSPSTSARVVGIIYYT